MSSVQKWGRHRRTFAASILIVSFFYLLLPNIRLPKYWASNIMSAVAWIGVAYFLLGIFTSREGWWFRFCRSLTATVGAFFLMLNFLPFSYWLAKPLLYDSIMEVTRPVAVVLGAGVTKEGALTLNSFQRTVRGVQLYHEGKTKLLLFSTGATSPSTASEAEAMARMARSIGVPSEAILLENSSKNTDENAKFTAEILHKREVGQVLLVTDPIHMYRAIESFRYYGIKADPAPTKGYLRKDNKAGWDLFQRTLHEYIGIAYYRLNHHFAD